MKIELLDEILKNNNSGVLEGNFSCNQTLGELLYMPEDPEFTDDKWRDEDFHLYFSTIKDSAGTTKTKIGELAAFTNLQGDKIPNTWENYIDPKSPLRISFPLTHDIYIHLDFFHEEASYGRFLATTA